MKGAVRGSSAELKWVKGAYITPRQATATIFRMVRPSSDSYTILKGSDTFAIMPGASFFAGLGGFFLVGFLSFDPSFDPSFFFLSFLSDAAGF